MAAVARNATGGPPSAGKIFQFKLVLLGEAAGVNFCLYMYRQLNVERERKIWSEGFKEKIRFLKKSSTFPSIPSGEEQSRAPLRQGTFPRVPRVHDWGGFLDADRVLGRDDGQVRDLGYGRPGTVSQSGTDVRFTHTLDWLIDWLIDWLFDWLIVRLLGWLIDWLIDWLIGWFLFVFPSGIIAEHRRQSSSTTLPIRNLSTRPRPGCASSSARPIRTLSSPWPGTSRTWSTNAPWSTRKRRRTPTSRACSFWRPPPRAESTSMNSFWPSPKSSRKPSRPGRAAKARPSTSTPARARPSPAAVAAAMEETPHRRTTAARRRGEIRRKNSATCLKKKSGGGESPGGGRGCVCFFSKKNQLVSRPCTEQSVWHYMRRWETACYVLFFTLKHRRNCYHYLPNFHESSCRHFHFRVQRTRPVIMIFFSLRTAPVHPRNFTRLIHAYLICRNKRPGRLIFRSNRKTFQNLSVLCTPPFEKSPMKSPSVLCTPPFEKSPIKSHRFCVLPPLKNHPSKAIGFVYSPLWKITHQKPSVLCTPPFEKSSIKSHRFCVLPPLKNHPSKSSGFVYSPLWKIIHQKPSVLCTPPFEKSSIKAHRFCVLPPLKNHPAKPIKGGSTQNRWLVMGDFSQGGVHKTDGVRWVIFQRGSTQNRRVLMGFRMCFYCFWKLSARAFISANTV